MNAEQRTLATIEAGRVKRYHAVPTVELQTIGLHSYGVAVLCLYLTDGTISTALLTAALLHDAPEIVTGDIPFTVKRDAPEIKKALAPIEDWAHRNVVMHKPELSPEEEAILKLADTIEGYLWCQKTESHMGPVKDRWVGALHDGLRKFADVVPEEVLARARRFLAIGPYPQS